MPLEAYTEKRFSNKSLKLIQQAAEERTYYQLGAYAGRYDADKER